MVAAVLTDATLWAADYNLTSATHQLMLNASVKEQDVTVFGGNGYVSMIAGLRQVSAEVHGYWDAPLGERGLLFAPVRFTSAVLRQREFVYRPSYVVEPDFLISSLFVRFSS